MLFLFLIGINTWWFSSSCTAVESRTTQISLALPSPIISDYIHRHVAMTPLLQTVALKSQQNIRYENKFESSVYF